MKGPAIPVMAFALWGISVIATDRVRPTGHNVPGMFDELRRGRQRTLLGAVVAFSGIGLAKSQVEWVEDCKPAETGLACGLFAHAMTPNVMVRMRKFEYTQSTARLVFT